jgi:hypothetical protein
MVEDQESEFRTAVTTPHENVLRKWVKEFAAAPAGAFPGHGQVKPEQLEMCLFPQGNLRSAVTPLAQLGMLGTTVNLGERR